MKITSLKLVPCRWPAALAALILGGCAVPANLPPPNYQKAFAYTPTPAPVTFPIGVHVFIEHTVTPEARRGWIDRGAPEAWIPSYSHAIGTMIGNDIALSGLFRRSAPAGTAPDYTLKIDTSDGVDRNEMVFVMNYVLADARAERVVSQRTIRHVWPPGAERLPIPQRYPAVIAELRTAVASDLQDYLGGKKIVADQSESDQLQKTNLEDLIAGTDATVKKARNRNHAIIAAKTERLPALLRDRKSSELTALVVKIEQTILDLNHECELNKDRAQREIANASGAATPENADALRELTITYRERIELLKPIAAAVREELANRNR
jgi:hypothetical protein